MYEGQFAQATPTTHPLLACPGGPPSLRSSFRGHGAVGLRVRTCRQRARSCRERLVLHARRAHPHLVTRVLDDGVEARGDLCRCRARGAGRSAGVIRRPRRAGLSRTEARVRALPPAAKARAEPVSHRPAFGPLPEHYVRRQNQKVSGRAEISSISRTNSRTISFCPQNPFPFCRVREWKIENVAVRGAGMGGA